MASEVDEVWGVIYEVTMEDLAKLDKFEGYVSCRAAASNSYNRREIEIQEMKNPEMTIKAWTYFATKETAPPPPSADYLGQIIEGATRWGLPTNYIAGLKAIQIE